MSYFAVIPYLVFRLQNHTSVELLQFLEMLVIPLKSQHIFRTSALYTVFLGEMRNGSEERLS